MFSAMFGWTDWSVFLAVVVVILEVWFLIDLFADGVYLSRMFMEDSIMTAPTVFLFSPGVLSACIMMFEAPFAGQETIESGRMLTIYCEPAVLAGTILFAVLMYIKWKRIGFCPAWRYAVAGIIAWIFQYISRTSMCLENPYYIWLSYLVVPAYGLMTGGWGILPKKKKTDSEDETTQG